jgi:thiamine pyrophosphokinase
MTPRDATIAQHAIVLADGDGSSRADLDAAWPGWDEHVDYVVAADGGARLATALSLPIDEWVGDGDSLEAEEIEALRRTGVEVELASTDKDETDTELALLAALRAGARDVTIIGAVGGSRVDHELANVQLLAHPAAAGVKVQLLDGGSRLRLLAAPASDGGAVRLELPGRPGDFVSLIPLVHAVGVTTSGLRYPLSDALLRVGPARGVSNVRERPDASVLMRSGRLLVVEVPATLAK